MAGLDTIKGGFAAVVRGLRSLWADAAITAAEKDLNLAQQGYIDVGRVLMPVSPEEQQRLIARAQRDLESAKQEQEGLER